jgi:copper transport protein
MTPAATVMPVTLLLSDGAARLSDPVVWQTAVARWLLFAGLSVALGGLAGRGLARQYKGAFPAPLPAPWALRGSLLGVAASAWLALIAGPAHLLATTAGTIAGVEFAAFVIAAGLLRLRQPGAAVLPLLAVVAAEGVRAHPESIIPVAGALITYCHLLPAAIWAGMLFYTLRAALAWRYHPADMRGLMRLYATAAAWLFTVIVVTGIISALVLVPLRSLTTTYGLVLIAKAVLVAAAAGLAVAGRIWLRRHPVAGAGPALATKVECAAIAAVLALTGLLTALTPPATPVRPAAAIRPEPARSGPAADQPSSTRS